MIVRCQRCQGPICAGYDDLPRCLSCGRSPVQTQELRSRELPATVRGYRYTLMNASGMFLSSVKLSALGSRWLAQWEKRESRALCWENLLTAKSWKELLGGRTKIVKIGFTGVRG